MWRQIQRRRPHLLLACVVAGLMLAPAGAPAVACATAVAGVIAAYGFGKEGVAAAAALLLGAATFGEWRMESIDRPAKAAPIGARLEAEATLLEHPRRGVFGSSAAMRIDSGLAKGLRIMARGDMQRWPSSDPGARFRIIGLVRDEKPADAAEPASGGRASPSSPPAVSPASRLVPSEANAGAPGTPGSGPLPARPEAGDSFDYAAFLRSRGIGREVRVESLVPIGRRGGLAGLVDSIRRRAERAIGAHLSAERSALARGMVLGDDAWISESTRDDFQRSGLAHLLAASGANVALLCALALPILIAAGTAIRVRAAVLAPLVAMYVALAGSGASVMRAGVMAIAGLIALGAGRRSSAVYALLLAAAFTLALNPRATADPGWQLSFAAVIGMLALGPRIAARLKWMPHGGREAIAVTLAATITTAPLLAHQFGAVSLAALPANLVAGPAVAPIAWIGMVEAAAEQLAIAPPLAIFPHALESIAAPVQALALRWVAGTATRFADPGWAQTRVHLSWQLTAATYAIGAALVDANRRFAQSKFARPASGVRQAAGPVVDRVRSLSPSGRRAFAALIAALTLAAGAYAAGPPAPPRHLTVDFLDVGQGDSTLIRDPSGAAVLFDGGVPEARVDRILKRLGVRKLSVVVATHQSRDHHAGLLQVVRRFPVGLFLDGRDGVSDPSFTALEHEVDRRHIPRRDTRAGQTLRVGDMAIRILWPPPRDAATPHGDPNERATVAIVSEGGFDLLLSADAEAPVLNPLDLPPVDAMKVPHHGSAEDGLPELLDRLRPTVAAIETGRGNRYGHPRPSTLQALRTVPRVYRTDRDGTIELTVSAGRIAIRTHR